MTGRPLQRARTVYIGTGPFGVAALHRLATAPAGAAFELVGVITTPGRPAGRSGEIRRSPIELAADELGIDEILAFPRLRDLSAIDSVLGLRPDLVVLADDGRIVPPPILDVPFGALNLHPSLLPRHRGATPMASTILAGDTRTGVTIIRMNEGVDTGPIVAVDVVDLTGTETAPGLEARLAPIAADLLVRTIGPWLRGEIQASAQDDRGATLTRRFRRDDGRLHPARPAAELERQIRAFQPWPGSYLATRLGRIVVHGASCAPLRDGDRTGLIVADGDGFALAAADGRLVIAEAQSPGGRRMTAAELRRGRPALVGSTVE